MKTQNIEYNANTGFFRIALKLIYLTRISSSFQMSTRPFPGSFFWTQTFYTCLVRVFHLFGHFLPLNMFGGGFKKKKKKFGGVIWAITFGTLGSNTVRNYHCFYTIRGQYIYIYMEVKHTQLFNISKHQSKLSFIQYFNLV